MKGCVSVVDTKVKEQIKKLVDLQKIDSDIYAIKKILEEKPVLLEELKEDFESEKEFFKELQGKLQRIQLDRKDQELQLQGKEDEIAKANAQLLQIKTNKEYTAKITEIERIKADKSLIEEKVLISYDESDSISEEVKKEEVKISEKEKIFLAKKKEIESEVFKLEERIKIFQEQRKGILPAVNPTYLNRYERLLNNKGGLAIVPIYSNSCGGCYMNLAPQIINEIKLSDEMVECEMCSRLLYLDEKSSS